MTRVPKGRHKTPTQRARISRETDFSRSLFNPCHGTSHAKCQSAGILRNSRMQLPLSSVWPIRERGQDADSPNPVTRQTR
jgi:hypothetical protein